jgi:hypothetical protein
VAINTPGITKPGELGEILALHQLKSPSLDSKAKLKSPCLFLQVAHFLQITKLEFIVDLSIWQISSMAAMGSLYIIQINN